MDEQTYGRIEAEIASSQSPVGIDAKKTHVLILAKLESIERRLAALEGAPVGEDGRADGRRSASIGGAPGAEVDSLKRLAIDGVAMGTDAFDEFMRRRAEAGVDLDERVHRAAHLAERLTSDAGARTLEDGLSLAEQAPAALAALTDIVDEAMARAAREGRDPERAVRQGLTAALWLGERISTRELEALGTLLRSNALHPSAVETVSRMGDALARASEAPAKPLGPLGLLGRLWDGRTRRSLGFLAEFARQFADAMESSQRAGSARTNEGERR